MKRTRTSDDQSLVMVESASRCSSLTKSSRHPEDRISKLPDDILISILSLINRGGGEIEQVVRTSFLSRRWRFLWNQSLKSLAFTLDDRCNSEYKAAYEKFVNRVNLLLALSVGDGSTIEDFNLTFKLFHYHKRSKSDLHGWIHFVLQKRVKQLCFNLNLMSKFTLDHKVIRNHNLDSLVSLCLRNVDVTGEFLAYLLTICETLEKLSISDSTTLVDFTVSGPSLKLKYLKIYSCWELKHLHIHDVNLVTFEFREVFSHSTVVIIENTPHLVNARIVNCNSTAKVLSYLPQLQTLVLEFYTGIVQRHLKFPKLTSLVQLELLLKGTSFSCSVCASLLTSCPSIHELKLVFIDLSTHTDADKAKRLDHPHECLKVVEIVGFIGCKLDIGVALYIIENTILLEKIVVDTSHSNEEGTRERAIERAKQHLGTRLLHMTSTKLVFK